MKTIFGALMVTLFLISCGSDNTNKETTDSSEQKALNASQIGEANAKLSTLKENIETGKSKHKFKQKLREEIGLKKFNTAQVEVSQAELFYDTTAHVHTEVMYFNTIPVGVKKWYITDNNNAYVEVFDYKKAEDATLTENLLYKVIIKPDMVNFFDAKIDLPMEKQAELSVEITNEQEILTALAQKYTPKEKED